MEAKFTIKKSRVSKNYSSINCVWDIEGLKQNIVESYAPAQWGQMFENLENSKCQDHIWSFSRAHCHFKR